MFLSELAQFTAFMVVISIIIYTIFKDRNNNDE